MLTLLLACKPIPPPPPPTFVPTSVGFGIDGVITEDGSVTAFSLYETIYQPVMVVQFVSDAYADTTDIYAAQLEQCVFIASFEPDPLEKPDQIPTFDDSVLFVSYDTTLAIEASDCPGRAEPERWGDEAEGLRELFDGAHFGYGIGPMTDTLRASWSAESLEAIGPSMLASWVAIDDPDGGWVARDWTTVVAYDWDSATGAVVEDEVGDLVPAVVDTLTVDDPRPDLYLHSTPNWFQPIDDLVAP